MDLTNHLLIAMPHLQDPDFAKAVTYICAHNDQGAMGIVINKPLNLALSEVLGHLDIDVKNEHIGRTQVMQGGGVQRERGFVIHQPIGSWESVIQVSDDIGVATSLDVLDAVANGDGPEKSLVVLGYAGWDAGQLEEEVAQNAWLTTMANSQIIFDIPYEDRWAAATQLLGFDPEQLYGSAGHG